MAVCFDTAYKYSREVALVMCTHLLFPAKGQDFRDIWDSFVRMFPCDEIHERRDVDVRLYEIRRDLIPHLESVQTVLYD